MQEKFGYSHSESVSRVDSAVKYCNACRACVTSSHLVINLNEMKEFEHF